MSLTFDMPVCVRDGLQRPVRSHVFHHQDHNAAPAPSAELFVKDTTLIAWGEYVEVYRGTLARGSGEASLSVVCKLALESPSIKRLAKEQRLYDGKLKHLQGVCLPRCYGYYTGEVQGEPRTILVLEDCGEEVRECFAAMKPAFKTQLIEAFREIHRAGVEQRDLAERNILVKDGHPIVIDFGEAVEVECQCKMDIVQGAVAPREAVFNCDELYQLCRNLKIWRPKFIYYINGYYPISYAADARRLAMKAPPNYSRADALRAAHAAILEHAQRYDPHKYEAL
ncbi:hypothetical protein BV25DRAFT_756902 [Artomyces pyxidatus]|uniref:Uncharacterized protein n=1 Tax=Artomyces pyxidatus TaxID=48021 RepID=A0ACB8SYA5_9AGAM|nr:hypothetical protein BV25DRAFT_756902 [Artomyces pyxidatus]